MDDMNDMRYHEHRDLDAMNSSRLWMIRTIMGHEIKALDVMDNCGLWLR